MPIPGRCLGDISRSFSVHGLCLVQRKGPRCPSRRSCYVNRASFSLSVLKRLRSILLRKRLSSGVATICYDPLSETVRATTRVAPSLPRVAVSSLARQGLKR